MSYWAYIVKCKDGSFYTGITWNLGKRTKEHIIGKVPFTKNRMPIKLVFYESFQSREMAAKREKEIKGWRRKKKEWLIKKFAPRDKLSLP